MNIFKVPFDTKLRSKSKAAWSVDRNAVFWKVQDSLADLRCGLRHTGDQLSVQHHVI